MDGFGQILPYFSYLIAIYKDDIIITPPLGRIGGSSVVDIHNSIEIALNDERNHIT